MKPRVWWTKTGIGKWWWACWSTDQHPVHVAGQSDTWLAAFRAAWRHAQGHEVAS